MTLVSVILSLVPYLDFFIYWFVQSQENLLLPTNSSKSISFSLLKVHIELLVLEFAWQHMNGKITSSSNCLYKVEVEPTFLIWERLKLY